MPADYTTVLSRYLPVRSAAVLPETAGFTYNNCPSGLVHAAVAAADALVRFIFFFSAISLPAFCRARTRV